MDAVIQRSNSFIKSREAISSFIYAALNDREIRVLNKIVSKSLKSAVTTRPEIAEILEVPYTKASRRVDMIISRMNKKLIPFDIQIKPCCGEGYFIAVSVANYASTVVPKELNNV